jgi:hypothetical protein
VDDGTVQAARCTLMRAAITGADHAFGDGSRREAFFNAAGPVDTEALDAVCLSFLNFAGRDRNGIRDPRATISAPAVHAALRVLLAYLEMEHSPDVGAWDLYEDKAILSDDIERDVPRSSDFFFTSVFPGLDSSVCANHKQVLCVFPLTRVYPRGCVHCIVNAMTTFLDDETSHYVATCACMVLSQILCNDDDGFRAGLNCPTVAGTPHPRTVAMNAGALHASVCMLKAACDTNNAQMLQPAVDLLLGLCALHPTHMEGTASKTVHDAVAGAVHRAFVYEAATQYNTATSTRNILVSTLCRSLAAVEDARLVVGVSWLLLAFCCPAFGPDWEIRRQEALESNAVPIVSRAISKADGKSSPSLQHLLSTLTQAEGPSRTSVRAVLLKLIACDPHAPDVITKCSADAIKKVQDRIHAFRASLF